MVPKTDLLKPGLQAWHERFAACVRNRDFAGGCELFAPECLGFGTVAEFADGRDRLIRNQWHIAWNATRDFHFLPDSFQFVISQDGSLACVLALWESRGNGANGRDFQRRGRCTTLLRRAEQNPAGWVAVHTHYSKTPDGKI